MPLCSVSYITRTSKKSPIPFKSVLAPTSKLQRWYGTMELVSVLMTTNRVLKGLLIAALLVSGVAHGGDSAIRVSHEAGQPVARFTIGDSRCVLKDDQVRCTPVSK